MSRAHEKPGQRSFERERRWCMISTAGRGKGQPSSARKNIKLVEVYQIKVTLRDSQPPIWRQIQVRSDTTLAKLHRILQRAVGWEDTHLHQLVIQDERYGARYKNDEGPRKMRDERKHKLGDVLPAERLRVQV